MGNTWHVWLSPLDCSPPHRVTHPEKFSELITEFCARGWDESNPRLLGYFWPEDGRVQLISGSHRWAAALCAEIDIPVDVYPFEFIQEIWGTQRWLELLAA